MLTHRVFASLATLAARATLAAAVCACGARAARPIDLVLVAPDPEITVARDAVPGLDVRARPVPEPPAPDSDRVTPILTDARRAYANGEFATCRTAVARVDVGEALATGHRDQAARQLVLDAACAYGSGAIADAAADGDRLATLGLDLPDLALAQEVEVVLGHAIVAAGARALVTVAVGGPAPARLAIDGRDAGCTLPCQVQLRPGAHVFAIAAEGFVPAHRWASVVPGPVTATIVVEQSRAAPSLAGEQWRARVGRGLPATDELGGVLLARWSGQRRLAYLAPSAGGGLTGTLLIDGTWRAAATRPRGEARALIEDLAYDGGVLHRPPVWQRPWFWIGVSAAAIAATGIVIAVTYDPPVVTTVQP